MFEEDDFDIDTVASSRSAILVGSFDVKGAVFVVPIDAPIPSELTSDALPSGSLYKRLAALDIESSDSYAFVPLSGAELLNLERSWRALQSARRIYVLADLPAARYDVLFTQAVRQIGLQKVDWSHVSEAIASKVITDQRTKDKTPWAEPMIDGVEVPLRRARLPMSSTGDSAALAIPTADEEP